mmetsp:Transcript_21426/g.40817  ORF Transcript_21426/g.40817 Transcript_21426/m.40817 type:complete len:81 (-) Transcript_21426:24-266(-)
MASPWLTTVPMTDEMQMTVSSAIAKRIDANRSSSSRAGEWRARVAEDIGFGSVGQEKRPVHDTGLPSARRLAPDQRRPAA